MIIERIYRMLFGSLRRQLIFSVAAVHAVMMALFVIDLTWRQEALLLDRQAEEATALAYSLSTASNHWLASHDISGLQELVEAQRRYPELRFAMLLDRNGRILAHTDRSHFGQFVQDLPSRVQPTELARNRAMVDVIVPVIMSGRHVGWARIGVGQLVARQKAAEISRDGMLYAFVAIFAGSLLAWLMGRRLTRRLSSIQSTMDEVSSGNSRARSHLIGIDEAADLSTGFNAMLDTLEELNIRIRSNEEKFRILVESIPDMIVLFDREGRYSYVNPTVTRTFGLPSECFLGKTSQELAPHFANDENNLFLQGMRQAIETGEANLVESALVLPVGRQEYELRHIPELDEGGNVISVLGIAHDVTERNRAEEALHIQTVELEQEVAEHQMAQENLQDQTLLLEVEIEKRQKVQDELEKMNVNLEQRVYERTTELCKKNDEVQKAYDDLKKAQAQLLQQDKMASIGLLSAGVAHEINNPMGFIISNLSSLGKYVEKVTAFMDAREKALALYDPAIRQMEAQDRQKYKIDHICKDMPELITETSDGAQRVRQIVQDLKRFSRSDNSDGAYSDINEGVKSTLSIAWNELKYKATIVKEYGQLPQIWCNLGQLNQVFLNILVNAAHAIEDHGEIRITTWEKAGEVQIAISDTGCGIAPEDAKKIFDPFFTTKEVGKGTGLGLAIAYDIVVNKHGGRIDVTSEIGKGSTFTITLPVQKGA